MSEDNLNTFTINESMFKKEKIKKTKKQNWNSMLLLPVSQLCHFDLAITSIYYYYWIDILVHLLNREELR